MGKEIERKFLVINDSYRALTEGITYRQGFLNSVKERTVRVRVGEGKGYLTIKGIAIGATRLEYEYEVPLKDAEEMLDTLCETPLIHKVRFTIKYKGFNWEVDEFLDENQGLIVAEVELESEEQVFEKPERIGEEVTGDPKYFNSNLIKNPYRDWY